MKNTCRALLVFIFTYSQAFAAGPVIWNGTRSKALTQKGFVLSDSSVVDNDGQLNYVKNGHGEVSATGWTAYADAAGTTPVDCTGGTVSETITKSSTTPLVGAGSLLLTKDAANRQGEGAAYNFTIDNAYKSTPLQIKVTALGSANYAASDIGIYVYDVTNAQLLTPAAVNIAAGTFTLNSFFVATTSTSYRLCVHTQSTNASAWTLQLDSVSVGPQSIGVGPALSGWETSTGFTYSGFGTVSTQSVQIKRVSDTMVVRGNFTSGTAAASQAYIILPSGYHINTSAISATTRVPLFGFGVAYSSAFTVNYSGAGNPFGITYDGTNTDRVALSEAVSSNSFAARNGNNVCVDASGDILSFEFEIPIAEWAGSANNSVQADRAVEEYAYNSSTSTNTNDTTSFAYGPSGAQIQNITADLSRTVQFQNAIQPTDSIFLEVSSDRVVWRPVQGVILLAGNNVFPYTVQNGVSYGIGVYATGTNQVTVKFGTYCQNGSTYGAASSAWSTGPGSAYWRVRKVSGGALVGYPQSTDNILGRTDGLAQGTGYIGQVLTAGPTTTAITANGSFNDIVTLTLPVGGWTVYGGGYCASGGATSYVYVSRWKPKGTADTTDGKSQVYGFGTNGDRGGSVMTPYNINITAADVLAGTNTITMQVSMTESGSPSGRSWIQYIWAQRTY